MGNTSKKPTATKQNSMIYVASNQPDVPSNYRGLLTSEVNEKSVSTASFPDIYKGHFSSLLIPNTNLHARTKEIASYIHSNYPHGEPLVMLCILKGSVPFYSLLCDQLSLLGHPFMIDFYRVKSYEGTGSSGKIKVFGDVPKSIQGRHVIIVEDIVDTGSTLKDVLPKVAELKPKSCKVSSMLVKRLEENHDDITDVVELDDGLIGFSIPNAFVVGYGLDYNEMYRDLRDIWILGEVGIQGGGFGL